MLPQKKQAMYNEDLASKPQPKREVDNARKLFVDAVKQMEKDGAINLEDILSGGDMIEYKLFYNKPFSYIIKKPQTKLRLFYLKV